MLAWLMDCEQGWPEKNMPGGSVGPGRIKDPDPDPRSEPQPAGPSSGPPDPSPPVQLFDGDGSLLQREVPLYGDGGL